MLAGAMAELAQQWLAGNLGSDLDAVVDYLPAPTDVATARPDR